ncbi:hypothetical protein LY76DRAFT_589580 [Colletotrichum caudatum]|nr:hypothetical protein LY76DRAFT_589580 [Colletotrichum caudatum]
MTNPASPTDAYDRQYRRSYFSKALASLALNCLTRILLCTKYVARYLPSTPSLKEVPCWLD